MFLNFLCKLVINNIWKLLSDEICNEYFCRDFAYVARDRTTRKHMCHVFRCDMPARTIANTLRDICKKIMIERSLQQNLGKAVCGAGVDANGRSLATRPNNLPTEHRRPGRTNQMFVCEYSVLFEIYTVNWCVFRS